MVNSLELVEALAISSATLAAIVRRQRLNEDQTTFNVAGFGAFTLREVLDKADAALGNAKADSATTEAA